MVKVFTNSCHLPWGSFGSPYLEVPTISAGTLTAQFPLAQLHVHRLLLHSDHPSIRERGRWAKNLPSPHGDTVGKLRRGASFVPPLPLSVPIVSSNSSRDVSMQTEEPLSFSLALRQLQEVAQAKAQLDWRLVLKLERLAKNYEDQ